MPLLTKEHRALSIKPEAARLLSQISRLLAARNIRAYIVGGFVRDTLLGRVTADIDIAVAGDAQELVAMLAQVTHYYRQDLVRHPTLGNVLRDSWVDIWARVAP